MKIKNLATATLALTMSASSLAAYQLVPNGDFENGGDSWGFEYGNGGTVTYETTGGNTGGYQRMDNTNAGWGSVGISTDAPGGAAPSVFGMTAGNDYTVSWDQLSVGGVGGLGIKLEFYGASNSVIEQFESSSEDVWETKTLDFSVPADTTLIKIVTLGIHNGFSGYDNVAITNADASAVPVPAAAWLFGSALAGLVAVRRKK
jgi:hypothetical protein